MKLNKEKTGKKYRTWLDDIQLFRSFGRSAITINEAIQERCSNRLNKNWVV